MIEYQKEFKGDRYYHWYNETDNIRIPININYSREIVEQSMARCGVVNMRKFLYDRSLRGFYRSIKKGKGYLHVKTLKQFCRTFNVDINKFEQMGIALNPRLYPVDMNSKAFVKLKSHVLNEGRIPFKKTSIGMLSYSNQDPVLLKYFADVVRELGYFGGEPRLAYHVLEILASPVLSRALNASGLPFGRKTRTDPSLDHLLEENPELFKYHIKATLTEEGWCSLTIRGHTAWFQIAWGRAVDITDELMRGQIEHLRQIADERGKRKIPIKSITDPKLRRIIELSPPDHLTRKWPW